MREKGIDIVLRYNDGGRLYGVTFIDHNSRTVLNGSALGKEFSANALSARFADFSGGDRREDLQPAPPALSPDGNRPPAPAPDPLRPVEPSAATPGGHTTTHRDATPDLPAVGEAVGSLFSILTPDAGGQSDNGSDPKKRRKKKRRYGQQT